MQLAAEGAPQIIRRTRPARPAQLAPVVGPAANSLARPTTIAPTASRTAATDAQNRAAALQCLIRAGKLTDMIAALEQQIERSPKTAQLYDTLVEYYQATKQLQKIEELDARLVQLRPDDAEVRLRYARQLWQRRHVDEACREFAAVISLQPELLS